MVDQMRQQPGGPLAFDVYHYTLQKQEWGTSE
jgi:hypothetical protein